MKQYRLLFLSLLIAGFAYAQQVKTIGECTITYDIKIANAGGDATKILYIKGNKIRSEIVSSSFVQTTIYDSKTGEAVILRELNGEKYLSRFDSAQWKAKNEEWEGMSLTPANESKTILGYACKKAVATKQNGKSFVLYYTATLKPTATENPYQFKDIPGIVLEYEAETSEGKSIMYKATKIDFSPVPAAKFVIPESGYRVL